MTQQANQDSIPQPASTVVPARILPVIVLSQFAATSLWFAVNAVMPDLQHAWAWPAEAVGRLTSAVQLGFVAGTLVFALLMVADRFSPSRVFMVCALVGALVNAATLWVDGNLSLLLVLRFAVGFLLAGIYPVGMKIAASWYREGLGGAMGVLIGALILGTALPHGLRALAAATQGTGGEGAWANLLAACGLAPWQAVVLGVSLLAALGGLLTAWLVPDSPWQQRSAQAKGAAVAHSAGGLRLASLALIWQDRRLRASVFGYFGHMWEIYTCFVLVPLIVGLRFAGAAQSAWSFAIIGAGFIGCAGGGWLARQRGSARVAQVQLAVSAACCLVAPLMLHAPDVVFLGWLLLWGVTVSGDSPQFSALTARNAPQAAVGSVLTLVNCIGFVISVLSIELFTSALPHLALGLLLPLLGVGPLIGLWMFRPLLRA
ncbi:MFS transporter [Hylemonella gracilis str. Niagara R]|uniref:MFS transporter n=1 Tax=Hylemonella gracilis str. Niagara R TaxID=1458275 RepID=A0A016XIA8_9BURK|nr:MFS transporter [Hylemonella gracilis]EYC51307.1 MFS transporter [Hylemonella gracilis str. Niagara R]